MLPTDWRRPSILSTLSVLSGDVYDVAIVSNKLPELSQIHLSLHPYICRVVRKYESETIIYT